jgi:hypothetical protein
MAFKHLYNPKEPVYFDWFVITFKNIFKNIYASKKPLEVAISEVFL